MKACWKSNKLYSLNSDQGRLEIVTLDVNPHLMFDVKKQKNILVRLLMHNIPKMLFSNENMQLAMEKLEKSED